MSQNILISKDATVNMGRIAMLIYSQCLFYSTARRPLLAKVIICEPQHQVHTKMDHSIYIKL